MSQTMQCLVCGNWNESSLCSFCRKPRAATLTLTRSVLEKALMKLVNRIGEVGFAPQHVKREVTKSLAALEANDGK